MFDQNQNPMPINRIEKDKAQSGHEVINLFGGILTKPLLVIPEQHFELLVKAGIDPNTMQYKETMHVSLLAHWKDSTVCAPSGKPYRNVYQIEDDGPESKFQQEMLDLQRSQLETLQMIYLAITGSNNTSIPERFLN